MYWLRVVRISAAALVVLVAAGLLTDATEGFPFTRRAPGPVVWIGGLLCGGALSIVSEMLFGGIIDGDRVSDPLGRRALRVTLLLTIMAVIAAVIVLIVARSA